MFDWLRSYRPDLIARYEKLYSRGAYAPANERERVNALVQDAWADAAPEGPRRKRYVPSPDESAPHRVPEAAENDWQEALF